MTYRKFWGNPNAFGCVNTPGLRVLSLGVSVNIVNYYPQVNRAVVFDIKRMG
jgi:hypothetical protein